MLSYEEILEELQTQLSVTVRQLQEKKDQALAIQLARKEEAMQEGSGPQELKDQELAIQLARQEEAMQAQEQKDQELAIQVLLQDEAVQLQVQRDLKLARQLSLQEETDATDPEGITYKRLRGMGLEILPTIANGSCMYDALRKVLQDLGILPPDATYKDVRRQVAEWLRQNGTEFAPDMFAPETRNHADGVDLKYMGDSMETICNNIATTDNWGCNAQLAAAAKCYRVGINVYSTDGPRFDRLLSPIPLKGDERYHGLIIRLLHISERHYEGVIKP